MTTTSYYILYAMTALVWLAGGVKLGLYLAKRKADEPNSTTTIEDTVWGFTIICTIHPDVEASHRCEVWIYDSKERIARVRMIGSSIYIL